MDDIELQLQAHPSFAAGVKTAEEELSNGRLGYRTHGKIVSWWQELADLLREDYGVEYNVVGGCISSMETAAEAAGYNSRMLPAIVERFGEDVIRTACRKIERKKKKGRRRSH